MKKLLIIGYSSLVKRRIISSLIRNNIPYDIASRSKNQKDFNAENWYHGYKKGLNNSDADIVYISLPNSLHYIWSLESLNKGFHTLVDKPATINLIQLKKLIKTAQKRKKIFSEAIFFNYHNQIKHVLNKLEKNKILRLKVNFSIPKPKRNSILSSKKLKGGVLMDMGPYISAISRLFFKSKPKKIIRNIIFKKRISSKIEVLFIYKDAYFFGKFSHDDDYKNYIEVYFKDKIIKLSRVFSPPALKKLEVKEFKMNKLKSKTFSDDIFKNYIKEIFIMIRKKKYNHYFKQMINDMKIRKNLQN